jgi:hypothetical protein
MQFKSMKMAALVAVVAATVGGATAGIGVETLWNNWRTAAEVIVVAFAAYAAMKMLKVMEKVVDELQWIAEKCKYIGKRMDAAAAKSADVCRHLQQVFLEFDFGAK